MAAAAASPISELNQRSREIFRLIVENINPDGTAAIIYAYGPLGSSARVVGGTLHGTGMIRDGELRFQNSDSTQFAFRPGIADLIGRMTTPSGQSYQATFKKTL